MRTILFGLCLCCLCVAVAFTTFGLGQEAAEPDTRPAATRPARSDDTQRLLAEREKRRGPTFPGLDAAFLVLPRPAERSLMAKELVSDQARQMNERALAFLVRAQDTDGGWSDTQFPSNTGVTALACLALMADGSRPRVGRFGEPLNAGLEFLLAHVEKGSGAIAGAGSNKYGPMYEHAFSTLALLMAYGDMPWKPEIRPVLANAIEAIKKSQKNDGGWRYQLSNLGDSDVSVTATVLWVMRTAKKCGFTVRQEAIDNGVRYVESCAEPDGTFRYRFMGLHASPSLGGAGIVALCNQGRLDHRLIPRARDRIVYDYRRYTVDDLKERRYAIYGIWYASLAMYTCGDQYWIPWFKKALEVLAAMQRKDGEFWDETDNVVYPTAMAAMVLQAPLGYLPIYER